MARKQQLPAWIQIALVWIVMSTLSAFGVLYLRASGAVGDGIFQPLAAVVCTAGDGLETSYVERSERMGRDNAAQSARRQRVFALDAATCVAADGGKRSGTGFVPAVWGIAAVFWGVLCLLAWRRQPRARRLG